MALVTAENLDRAELADPITAGRVAGALDAACREFGIDTGLRLAGFLSQCSHESAGFRATVENLNYGTRALLSLFPGRFNTAEAVAYARQPERIANRIYGGRMGNGPETSGDGWRFRGRGFIQLTGHDNYVTFGLAIGDSGSLLVDPDSVALPDLAARSAAWFWTTHGLNEIADTGDVVRMTRAINGGTMGLDDRRRLYGQALPVYAP